LATWQKYTWLNYQRKAFSYVVDYPHGKIATWIITTWLKNQVFCSDGAIVPAIKGFCFGLMIILIKGSAIEAFWISSLKCLHDLDKFLCDQDILFFSLNIEILSQSNELRSMLQSTNFVLQFSTKTWMISLNLTSTLDRNLQHKFWHWICHHKKTYENFKNDLKNKKGLAPIELYMGYLLFFWGEKTHLVRFGIMFNDFIHSSHFSNFSSKKKKSL
jgi:hypothetical protein